MADIKPGQGPTEPSKWLVWRKGRERTPLWVAAGVILRRRPRPPPLSHRRRTTARLLAGLLRLWRRYCQQRLMWGLHSHHWHLHRRLQGTFGEDVRLIGLREAGTSQHLFQIGKNGLMQH